MSCREAVEAFFAYWSVQDVELACALFDTNIVYRRHVASNDILFGGEWSGIDACRQAMFSLLEEFDYLYYNPTILGAKRGMVRAHVAFKYRHRRTGGILEGTRRLVFHVKGDRILRIDSYHDARLVEAFMRLTKYRLESDQHAKVSELPTREKQRST
ncbi:MAG: nuclear transport factor 2 family protein [Hyphomicrobiaceae bacterium]